MEIPIFAKNKGNNYAYFISSATITNRNCYRQKRKVKISRRSLKSRKKTKKIIEKCRHYSLRSSKKSDLILRSGGVHPYKGECRRV